MSIRVEPNTAPVITLVESSTPVAVTVEAASAPVEMSVGLIPGPPGPQGPPGDVDEDLPNFTLLFENQLI